MPDTNYSSTLDAAIAYLRDGYAPIVLTSPIDASEPETNKRGKTPLHSEGWTQRPIPTETELLADYSTNPLYNIGLRTGIIQGARVPIVGFDIDGECMQTWESAISQAPNDIRDLIANTWTIKTGDGKRPIFSINKEEYPEGTVQSRKIVNGAGSHDEISLLANGRHSVAPPSIHPVRRTPYGSNNKPILPITRTQFETLIDIVKQHAPYSNSANESFPAGHPSTLPITDLFHSDYRIHEGQGGHNALRRAMIELIRNNAGTLTESEVKELAWQWNLKHCVPIFQRHEFEQRWKYAIEWMKRNSHLLRTEDQTTRQSKYQELAREYQVEEELKKHSGAVIKDNPPELVVANTDDKRIKIAHIKKATKKDPATDKVLETWHYVMYTDTVLDAIPERIVVIKDPLEDATKYEVEMASANGEVQTFGPAPFTDVIAAMEKTPLCFKPRSLHSYLAPLLRAHIESGTVEHRTEIDREGFFWVDGKIVGSKVEIRPVTQAQAQAAVGFIDELQKKFYNKDRDTKRLAHCIRLACAAPFDFARRQKGVAGNNNFIPRLDQYGWANTGKTYGYPKIILRIWRRDVEDYLKGNGSVDTAARFIKQTGFSTMPMVLDEVDFTSSWEKDGRVQNYIAILKNQCSMTHPRDTLTKESEIVARPSLAFPILTHNSDRITEDGFVKRYVGFGYTPDDEINKERELAFTKFLDERKEDHGIIGDFVAGYIVAHQDLLKESWDVIAKKALAALYELAGVKAPEWLWSKVEHTAMEDTKEIRAASIKAATLEMVNAAWAQNRHELADKNETHIPTLEQKITKLAENNLLPHIRLHKTEGVCLLSTFIEMLKDKHRITRISMEQLAVICGWKHKAVRLGDEGSSKTAKVVTVPLDRFVAFLTDGSVQTSVA